MPDRAALVTDGAAGLGGAVARRLAADGARVVVLDVDAAAATAAAAAIEADGGTALAFAVDVADGAAVRAAVDEARRRIGPVTILVNSTEASADEPFLEVPVDRWERLLDVNLTGTFTCCQAVLPDMLEARWGRIVNLTSAGVHDGRARRAPFVAAKAAVHGLTTSLALEVAGSGVTVNAVPTGMVDRPILRGAADAGAFDLGRELAATPVGRAGRPEDVAAVCAFLVSDEAGYITGQVIGVNGGRST
jgi:NAD(P)-dependent dehydrogenase (short-subunit alcohol dehydrogenase family)